jgi:hypothetical protein
LKSLVPAEGIEPPTFGLQNRCSTAELSRRLGRRGLIAASPAQDQHLGGDLHRRTMVQLERLH